MSLASTVDTSMDNYWVATTTIMPVLALAVIVEAREQVRRWTTSTNRTYRNIQSLLWATPILVFATGEGKGLQALRHQAIAHYWPSTCEAAISSALVILVLSPAAHNFFMANAESLAWMVSRHPRIQLEIFRISFVFRMKIWGVRFAMVLARRKMRRMQRGLNGLAERLQGESGRRLGAKTISAGWTQHQQYQSELAEARRDLTGAVGQLARFGEEKRIRIAEQREKAKSLSDLHRRAALREMLPDPATSPDPKPPAALN